MSAQAAGATLPGDVLVQGYLAHKTPPPLGPYRRPMPRVLGGSSGGVRFLMSEVPLYSEAGVELGLRV